MSSHSPTIDLVDLVSDDEANRSSDSVLILEQDSGIVVEECEEGDGGDQDQEEAPVVVQDGALTLTPLIAEARSSIQKRKAEEEEIFLDDDINDEDQSMKKRILTGVRWTGKSVRTKNSKTYYTEVTLKLGPREKKVVPGQYLLITPDEEEHQSLPHFACRILSLYTMTWQGKQSNMAHVQRFARGENTILGKSSDPREYFLVEECEDVYLESVSRILDIEYLPVNDFAKWRAQGGTRAAIMKEDAGGKVGWWRLMYQPKFGRFQFPDRENIEIRGPGQCYLCDKRKEDIENRNEVVSEDGKSVRIQGSWYSVGQHLMITESTIRSKIPAKIPKSYPKPNVDSKLYSEHWRKPEVYKSDHMFTMQPFQVVRLEKVIQKSSQDFCILLRLLYRPQDTHLSHEEARVKPYSLLHWSEEMVLMYPREVADKKHKLGLERLSMDKVIGNCYVMPMENRSEEDNLIMWTDIMENRFYVDKNYDADNNTFEPLQANVIKELKQALDLWPAPVLESVSALNTMDIFAGCGGLSTGLGQAGVANHKWAIEFWKPSADAYRKNNPQAKVYNQECNGLLKQAMDGS